MGEIFHGHGWNMVNRRCMLRLKEEASLGTLFLMASPINVGRSEGRLTNLRESGKKTGGVLTFVNNRCIPSN
jgi:hypothetical protein